MEVQLSYKIVAKTSIKDASLICDIFDEEDMSLVSTISENIKPSCVEHTILNQNIKFYQGCPPDDFNIISEDCVEFNFYVHFVYNENIDGQTLADEVYKLRQNAIIFNNFEYRGVEFSIDDVSLLNIALPPSQTGDYRIFEF